LTTPPLSCLMYGAVPDAPEDAADALKRRCTAAGGDEQ
jgi:hypothetical protein